MKKTLSGGVGSVDDCVLLFKERKYSVVLMIMMLAVKAASDMSSTKYLRSYRLSKAVELLKAGQKPSAVALSIGFSSASYFNKCFKAQ